MPSKIIQNINIIIGPCLQLNAMETQTTVTSDIKTFQDVLYLKKGDRGSLDGLLKPHYCDQKRKHLWLQTYIIVSFAYVIDNSNRSRGYKKLT